nr:hypothetical protein Iba_chr03fCG4460 [Ipomoea batatas]
MNFGKYLNLIRVVISVVKRRVGVIRVVIGRDLKDLEMDDGGEEKKRTLPPMKKRKRKGGKCIDTYHSNTYSNPQPIVLGHIYRGCYSMSPFVDMLKGIKLQGEKNQTLLRHHNP